jgi:hypothetical protein
MRSISAVEQLPVCSRITFGGAPQVMLRLAKSLFRQEGEAMCLGILPYDGIGHAAQFGGNDVN